MMNLHDVGETLTLFVLQPRGVAQRRRRAPRPFGLLAAALLGLSSPLGALGCSPRPAQAPVAAAAAPEPERSAWPEPPKPESVVHAEFQTSAQGVKPRGKFLLAVRFDIEEGYRISWQNPGDVGKTTHVVFEVPEGFSVGPLEYPAPQRFELPGKLVSYGYEHQTAIFAEVSAPDRLPDGRAYRFDVKADWLACKRECASEELSAWFELPSSALAPEPELSAELSAYHAAVPTAFTDLPDSSLDWKGGPTHPALTLKAAEVKWVDFLPGDGEQPKLLSMKPAGNELHLKFERATPSKPLRGLAVAEVDGKRSFFDVNLPFPSE
jgi:DsbC/DsbD-like thiol-disulfide interchange protein